MGGGIFGDRNEQNEKQKRKKKKKDEEATNTKMWNAVHTSYSDRADLNNSSHRERRERRTGAMEGAAGPLFFFLKFVESKHKLGPEKKNLFLNFFR